jgi:signal transduction histidine kinase
LERVDSIANSVHDLSNHLHPARLQLLGLVPSLRSLQRDHSQSGIGVVFSHDDLPAGLSPALTLCLFRVVQETLQNAVKYSKSAQVSVDLRREGAGLTLTVADDGVGFDLDTAWGRGLGLVSIRERVEACSGRVAIYSKPGQGTRVDVTVPLDVELAGRPAPPPASQRPELEHEQGRHKRTLRDAYRHVITLSPMDEPTCVAG